MSDETTANPELGFAELDPDNHELQTIRRDLGATSFGLNALTLQPGQRFRVHRHETQEEVYLVVEGELTLVVENEPHVLGPGRLARVGPNLRRQLTNPSSARVVVVAIGAAGDHESRDGRAWADWDEPGPGRNPKEVPMPENLPHAG
jgi:uncharacterized cupin superfamily protein